jgi:hypothetical protein
MSKMSYRLETIRLFLSLPFRRTRRANICGHRTKRAGKVTSCGETYILLMPISDNGNPDYCLKCIGKMTIKCAWCEKPIRIGDPVTLYIPTETFKVPVHAVRYDEYEKALVGCLRIHCADGGVDRQGFWVPPGKVARVPSPIEMLLEKGNGSTLIINDLSDPTDLGRFV